LFNIFLVQDVILCYTLQIGPAKNGPILKVFLKFTVVIHNDTER